MHSRATSCISCILLTGPPGIGKTTICMNIVSRLEKENRKLNGFYTEEVRGLNGSRIGFDIVLIKDKNKKIPLARIENRLGQRKSIEHQVGNYHVFVENLEKSVLPVIKTDTDILLIDEIGKMEMCSKKFHDEVSNIFFSSPNNKKTFIIATIPEKYKISSYPNVFKKLHEDKRFKIINVHRGNRNFLTDEIISMLS
ncbi:hypothetical protein M0802_007476 [Mischocyttarus mexicanus]|nr:hypothetical protein M0802_007476 [Mischocyttarus mexicanus]